MKKLCLILMVSLPLAPSFAMTQSVGGADLGDADYLEGPTLGDMAVVITGQEAEGVMNTSESALDGSLYTQGPDPFIGVAIKNDNDVIPAGGGFAVDSGMVSGL